MGPNPNNSFIVPLQAAEMNIQTIFEELRVRFFLIFLLQQKLSRNFFEEIFLDLPQYPRMVTLGFFFSVPCSSVNFFHFS